MSTDECVFSPDVFLGFRFRRINKIRRYLFSSASKLENYRVVSHLRMQMQLKLIFNINIAIARKYIA